MSASVSNLRRGFSGDGLADHEHIAVEADGVAVLAHRAVLRARVVVRSVP